METEASLFATLDAPATFEHAHYSNPDRSVARIQLWARDMEIAEHDATAPEPDEHAPNTTDIVVAVRAEDGRSLVRWLASGSRKDMLVALEEIRRDGWQPSNTYWNNALREWTRPALPIVEVAPDA